MFAPSSSFNQTCRTCIKKSSKFITIDRKRQPRKIASNLANILFIDQYAVLGGAQRILVDLATAFASSGHAVTALFPDVGPVTESLAKADVRTGTYRLRPMRAGKKGPIEKLRYFATAARSARTIRAAAGERNFDFVYVNGPRSMLPGVLAARRMHLPVVASVHLIHEGAERRLLSWCFARPHVKLVSFCSRFAAEPFGGVGAKGKILPNWVAPEFIDTPSTRDQMRASLHLGEEEVAVGVLGRISKSKGQRLFLTSALPLLEDFPNLRVLLAGGADFEDSQEELELKALTAPFGARVSFLERASACGFLDALDVSVVPSIRPESFGLVAIESMARGLPVVATKRGGLLDTVVEGQTGLLVDPSAEEMQAAIRRLVLSSELRTSLGESGKGRVATEYSPDVLIPRTMAAVLGAIG